MRHLFISDIHGCYDEMVELLNKINYDSNKDKLIILGDNIDRGPNSQGVIKYLRENNILSILGNHEYTFLRWFKGNKYLTEQPHYTQFSDEDITFINNMPTHLILPEYNLWVVHAGIKPNIPIDKQDQKDLLYLRYTDEERKTVSIKKVLQGIQPPDTKFWTEFGPFNANIIYGHEVHSLEFPRIKKFDNGTWCAGIDTGCCFGGHLSALIIEDNKQEIIQVKAKKEYYKGWKRIE